MSKKPDLDEPTLRIAERMLRMPPKPHEKMKIGASKKSDNAKTDSKRSGLKKGSSKGRQSRRGS